MSFTALIAVLGLASCSSLSSSGGSSGEISATEDVEASDSGTPTVDKTAAPAAVVAGSELNVESDREDEPEVSDSAADVVSEGSGEGTVVLAGDEPISEDAAEPPPIATEPESDVVDEADQTVDPLDPGSALACAALEIGRDGAQDGDLAYAARLAGQVDQDAVGDRAIQSIVADVASSDQADLTALARGIERCESLGYETAS